MKDTITDVVLGAAVLCAWLGTFAFLRFGSAPSRLHCTSFVLVTCGPLLVAAAFLEEGATSRSIKVAALIVLLVLSGAVLGHAVGRALLIRNGRGA